jgi:hypothetical protein
MRWCMGKIEFVHPNAIVSRAVETGKLSTVPLVQQDSVGILGCSTFSLKEIPNKL